MDTDETTERVNAPTVPSWKRSPSPIFVSAPRPENPNPIRNKKKHPQFQNINQKGNRTAPKFHQQQKEVETAEAAIPRREK